MGALKDFLDFAAEQIRLLRDRKPKLEDPSTGELDVERAQAEAEQRRADLEKPR